MSNSLLRKAFAAAVIAPFLSGAAYNAAPAQAADTARVSTDVHQSLDSILKKDRNQFIILQDTGDSGHGNIDNGIGKDGRNALSFLANPRTAEFLAANGYKNIAMEIRHEFQPLADEVAAGRMTPDQYAQGKADLYRQAGDEGGSMPSARSVEEGKVIAAAARKGIKVLCVETQASDLKEHGQLIDRQGMYEQSFYKLSDDQATLGSFISANAKGWISSLTNGYVFANAAQNYGRYTGENEIKAAATPHGSRLNATLNDLLDKRISGDAALGDYIKAKVGSEKTAIFYGSDHGAHAHDLDEVLNARKVALFSSEDSMRIKIQLHSMRRLQSPDHAIALDSGKAYDSDAIDKMIDKTAPRIKPASSAPAPAVAQ